MNPRGDFRRVAILGAGLIGASFGAAIEKTQPGTSIVAFDRPEVLERLRASKFQWECTADVGHAVHGAELVYIALPVVTALEVLNEISSHSMPNALVTDAGSTKAVICKAAQTLFGPEAMFVGGHPIAGRELAGFEHATAELFRGKRYALVSDNEQAREDSRIRHFVELLRAIGAEPVWIEAEAHDRAMAVLSQMPQLVAIALAGAISRETRENGASLSLSGNGLRDMLRTAASPYEIWRDICATNHESIAHVLDRVGQEIHFLREHLTSGELEIKFRDANELHRVLHGMAMVSRESSPEGHVSPNRAGVNG
jgi:prephenate dehydrogenase